MRIPYNIIYYTVSFNAFKHAIGQSGGCYGFSAFRFLKSYSTWHMCLLDDYLFRELSLSFWWGCHIFVASGEFLAPPLLKIIQIIQYYCCELMRLFYNQLNCHSDKWPNNANTRVASLSVVLQRNNSVTSMRAPELTFRVSA